MTKIGSTKRLSIYCASTPDDFGKKLIRFGFEVGERDSDDFKVSTETEMYPALTREEVFGLLSLLYDMTYILVDQYDAYIPERPVKE